MSHVEVTLLTKGLLTKSSTWVIIGLHFLNTLKHMLKESCDSCQRMGKLVQIDEIPLKPKY